MTPLRIDPGTSRVIATGVAGTFDEANLRNAGKAPEILHSEDQRPFHEAVDEKFVPLWVDFRNPGVMALEMESGRSDDPVEILQGRPARPGAWCHGIAEIPR